MISNYQVIVDKADLRRLLSALFTVRQACIGQAKEGIPRRAAVEYHYLVRVYIINQRFASSYAPYNMLYANWKFGTKEPKWKGDFWILTGALLRALTVFKYKGGWMGGIPSGVKPTEGTSWLAPRGPKNPGKRKAITQYGRWGEFGRQGQPERPIFRPTMDLYFASGFKTVGKKALRDIGRLWR